VSPHQTRLVTAQSLSRLCLAWRLFKPRLAPTLIAKVWESRTLVRGMNASLCLHVLMNEYRRNIRIELQMLAKTVGIRPKALLLRRVCGVTVVALCVLVPWRYSRSRFYPPFHHNEMHNLGINYRHLPSLICFLHQTARHEVAQRSHWSLNLLISSAHRFFQFRIVHCLGPWVYLYIYFP
jgi:hypothetical protein